MAARDGSLMPKPIYGMYTSQGWVDAPPDVGSDIERDGYVYTTKLYGDPSSNAESMLVAIYPHPRPFARRVVRNAGNFYGTLTDPRHFGRWWLGVALLGAIVGISRPQDRASIAFLAGTFLATHFLLIFHVDPRYLTIAAPVLILFPASLLARGLAWSRRWRTPVRAGLMIGVLVMLAWMAHQHGKLVSNHGERPDRAIQAMRSLAAAFLECVLQPVLGQNQEPHIAFLSPHPTPLRWEDMFLLGYFTRTAWYMHAPEAPFSRGRLYSFRECEDDYVFAPATLPVPFAGGRNVFTYENPILGQYTLWERSR